MKSGKGRALVLGRQIFVDLWALSGFEPVYCENPQQLGSMLAEFLDPDVALIVVEEGWFCQVPDLVRRRLEMMVTPTWVRFPSLNMSLD